MCGESAPFGRRVYSRDAPASCFHRRHSSRIHSIRTQLLAYKTYLGKTVHLKEVAEPPIRWSVCVCVFVCVCNIKCKVTGAELTITIVKYNNF